jgi:Ca2+:H+ antiporter
MRIVEFQFSTMIAQTMSSFMFVAASALILPTAFDAGLPHDVSTQAGVLALSRGASIVLLILYICFLIYQLKTHSHVFEEEPLYGGQGNQRMTAQDSLIAPRIGAATLLVVTLAVSFCSDYLVGSIDNVVEAFGVSKTFIGLVLVPIVGNAGTSSL